MNGSLGTGFTTTRSGQLVGSLPRRPSAVGATAPGRYLNVPSNVTPASQTSASAPATPLFNRRHCQVPTSTTSFNFGQRRKTSSSYGYDTDYDQFWIPRRQQSVDRSLDNDVINTLLADFGQSSYTCSNSTNGATPSLSDCIQDNSKERRIRNIASPDTNNNERGKRRLNSWDFILMTQSKDQSNRAGSSGSRLQQNDEINNYKNSVPLMTSFESKKIPTRNTCNVESGFQSRKVDYTGRQGRSWLSDGKTGRTSGEYRGSSYDQSRLSSNSMNYANYSRPETTQTWYSDLDTSDFDDVFYSLDNRKPSSVRRSHSVATTTSSSIRREDGEYWKKDDDRFRSATNPDKQHSYAGTASTDGSRQSTLSRSFSNRRATLPISADWSTNSLRNDQDGCHFRSASLSRETAMPLRSVLRRSTSCSTGNRRESALSEFSTLSSASRSQRQVAWKLNTPSGTLKVRASRTEVEHVTSPPSSSLSRRRSTLQSYSRTPSRSGSIGSTVSRLRSQSWPRKRQESVSKSSQTDQEQHGNAKHCSDREKIWLVPIGRGVQILEPPESMIGMFLAAKRDKMATLVRCDDVETSDSGIQSNRITLRSNNDVMNGPTCKIKDGTLLCRQCNKLVPRMK